ADHFRLDEPALEIAVDRPCRLRRARTLADHPGAALVFAAREEALQAEQREPLAHQPVQAGLGETDGREILAALGLRQLLDLRLHLAADRDHAGTFGLRKLPDLGDQWVGIQRGQLGLIAVREVDRGLWGPQAQSPWPWP